VTTSPDEVARILRSQGNPATKDLYFCALLSREAGDQDTPVVVVGGSAIEIYSEGKYVSGDIDLVGSRTVLAGILESWAFTHENREWYNPEWRVAVDLVNENDSFTGSRRLIRTLVTPYGPVRLAAIEDLIIKRLLSAKYWEIPSDREHAAILARKYQDELDREYLSDSAKRAAVADEWMELERMVYSRRRRG